MSQAIGFKGLARTSGSSSPLKITFKKDTDTKVLALDPNKSYGLFAVGAGPSNVTLSTSADSQDAVSNGTAKYAAQRAYTSMPAAGGFLGVVTGVSAVKVIQIKDGVGTDTVGTVIALGGRFQVRAVEGAKADGGLGAYTQLTTS